MPHALPPLRSSPLFANCEWKWPTKTQTQTQTQIQCTVAVAVAALVARPNSGHRYERQLSVCRIMMLPFLQQAASCSKQPAAAALGHLQRQQLFIDINTRRCKYAECFSGQRALRMRALCGCECGCGAASASSPACHSLVCFCSRND